MIALKRNYRRTILRHWLILALAAISFGAVVDAQDETPAVDNSKDESVIVPEFHIHRVVIDGRVVNDRVEFVATIHIAVNRGEGWHQVPIRMSQAHITGIEYAGAGEEIPDVTNKVSDEGQRWQIRGLGQHQLKLTGWVPLKQNLALTQLQLSLPPLLPGFEAEVQLEIPNPDVVLRPGNNVYLLDVKRNEATTQVVSTVSGNRLELGWSIPASTGATVAAVGSRFHLKPTSTRLTLLADQTIEFYQQVTRELQVQPPSHFQLVEISGPHYRSHTIDEEGQVNIQLSQDVKGEIKLHWVFESPFIENEPIIIDGLAFKGAIREEGLIRIDELDGYLLIPATEQSELVHRASVSDVRDFGVGVPLTAYAFYKQPFNLVMSTSPTASYEILTPTYQLTVGEKSQQLRVDARVSVQRGQVSSMAFSMPPESLEGWEFEEATISPPSANPVRTEFDPVLGQGTCTWSTPLRTSFHLLLSFRRNRQLANDLECSLPSFRADRTAESIIALRAEDQLDLESWNIPDKLRLDIHSQDVKSRLTELVNGDEELIAVSRVVPDQRDVKLTLSRHEKTMTCDTLVQVVDVQSGDISIRQKIDLDVKYGRVSDFALSLPTELTRLFPDYALSEAIDVSVDGESLSTFFNESQVTAVLPQPVKGQATIVIDYAFPIDVKQATFINLPIVALLNQEFQSIQCEVLPVESVRLRAGDGWEPIRSSLWVAQPGKRVESVPVEVNLQLADSAQQYVVERAWARTHFFQDGRSETWVEYVFNNNPERVVLLFSDRVDLNQLGFKFDGNELDSSSLQRRSGDREELTVVLPESRSEHPTLTMTFRSSKGQPFMVSEHHDVFLPEFPSSVWVNESIWEVQLPSGHHLFTSPLLEPQFKWVRDRFFWVRKPTDEFQEQQAIVEQSMPPEFLVDHVNQYSFRGFGTVPKVRFQTMNRSMILLIGAGLTLLLGFVFWRAPSTRNVFSLLVLTFCVAVASLWFMEPILLLLQPAALGVMLALVATMFDKFRAPAAPTPKEEQDPRSHVQTGSTPTMIYQAQDSGSVGSAAR